MNKNPVGVIHYFYHCRNEELPVRDILNTNGKGKKTEPHLENLTENWFQECNNQRIKFANWESVEYLFLMTKYKNKFSALDNRILVVGYFKRANPEVWIKLSKKIPSGVNPYYPEPKLCGFFAGNEKESHFVKAKDAYILKNSNNTYLENARWRSWFVDNEETKRILLKLNKSENILDQLRKRVSELNASIYLKKNSCNKYSLRKHCK